jgi:hypothetical protein
MCGRTYAGRGLGFAAGRRPGGHGLFGLDVEKMSPGARVAAALSVLVPVALSGVFLVAFVPDLWWLFTTYFWVAFPAVGLLVSGVTGLVGERPVRVSEEGRERELLGVLGEQGEVTAATVAAGTSMTVAETDRRLKELAEGGHLEVRIRGGAIFYALWEAEERGIEGVR